ncbi:MAG: hypothetical protein ACKODX_06095 [Gemmata sp.]
MACVTVRARLVALILALPVALTLETRANGQEPALEVFYSKLEPKAKEQFKYKWKGQDRVCTAGVFRWEVPTTEFGTQGLDRNFAGYCAEVLVPITADKLYRFQTNNIYAIENYNVAGANARADRTVWDWLLGQQHAALPDDAAGRAAERRTKYILELFGRYFHDPVLKAVDTDEAVAFQIALWEIIQESEPVVDGALKLDLFSGDFQANYPKDGAPAYVTRAQAFLNSLTGTDDALFYENPDLRGRELIRLKGIENAERVVAQSQYALRFKGGGGVGGGAFARALTAGGSGFGGPPVGGASGAGGYGGGYGGGAVLGGTPGNGNTYNTTPGDITINKPPNGGPDTPIPPDPPPPDPPLPPPSNPVPAPAGLVLGAIALGTLGTWRLTSRAQKSK